MDHVSAVKVSASHIVAIKTDGTLWAWGGNGFGQIGDGTTEHHSIPVKVMSDVVTVEIGRWHTMALKNDGFLWTWGNNDYGQLGNLESMFSSGFQNVLISNIKLPNQPSRWAAEQVNAAISAGLVPQSLQAKYTQTTTRAEFCALAVALYENAKGEITARKAFADTKDVNVGKMAAIGVVNGIDAEGTTFSPDTQLTREQAATMLSRLADAMGGPLAKQAPAYADTGSFSPWASEAIGQAQAAGIMSGTGNNMFSPKAPYTREQSIVTILRLCRVID